jgi:hypothetical protein
VPVNTLYEFPGGTKAGLDTLAGASALEPRCGYWLSDQNRLAIAITASTYQTFAKEGEGGSTDSEGFRITAVGTGASQNITIPADYTTDSVNVYINGVRLHGLSGEVVVSGTTLTVTAPAGADILVESKAGTFTYGDGGGGGGPVAWADITGKPTTFAPSAHIHAIADVTGLQTALDGKQAAGSYAALVHTHAQSEITNLVTDLAGKLSTAHEGAGGAVHANVAPGGNAGFMTGADKTKLDGIATGATANATDSQLRDRATHTGTQAQSTVTNLTTDLAAKANTTDVVLLTGNQTIAGTKTFSSTISASISGTAANVTGTVALANGGTGSTTQAGARTNLGLGTAATRNITVSSTAPSSPAVGDLWIQS